MRPTTILDHAISLGASPFPDLNALVDALLEHPHTTTDFLLLHADRARALLTIRAPEPLKLRNAAILTALAHRLHGPTWPTRFTPTALDAIRYLGRWALYAERIALLAAALPQRAQSEILLDGPVPFLRVFTHIRSPHLIDTFCARLTTWPRDAFRYFQRRASGQRELFRTQCGWEASDFRNLLVEALVAHLNAHPPAVLQLAQLWKSPTAPLAELALIALGQRPHPTHVPILAQALSASRKSTRQRARDSLLAHPPDDILPHLNTLETSPVEHTRRLASRILQLLHAPVPSPHLGPIARLRASHRTALPTPSHAPLTAAPQSTETSLPPLPHTQDPRILDAFLRDIPHPDSTPAPLRWHHHGALSPEARASFDALLIHPHEEHVAPLLHHLCPLLHPEDRARWLDSPHLTPWARAALTPPAQLRALFRSAERTDPTLVIALLARNAGPTAITLLARWQHSSRELLRNAAGHALGRIAQARNLDIDTLLDQSIPRLGLDEHAARPFPYGHHPLRLELQSDGTFAILNIELQPIARLPRARRSDDKKALSRRRKHLKDLRAEALETFHDARARLTPSHRRWSPDRWRRDILAHPVLKRAAESLRFDFLDRHDLRHSLHPLKPPREARWIVKRDA